MLTIPLKLKKFVLKEKKLPQNGGFSKTVDSVLEVIKTKVKSDLKFFVHSNVSKVAIVTLSLYHPV